MFSVDSNETHTSFMPHLPAYVLVQEMKEIVVFDRDQFHTRYPGSFSNGESHTFDHLLQRKDLEEGGGRGEGEGVEDKGITQTWVRLDLKSVCVLHNKPIP